MIQPNPANLTIAADENKIDFVRQVRAILRASPYLPLRDLLVEPEGDAVIVRGRVPTQYLKKIIQMMIMEVRSTVEIRDEVVIVPPGSRLSAGVLS